MSDSLLTLVKHGRIRPRQVIFVTEIEISEVSSSGDRNAFIKFPWRIYRNDPAWVPPLILERKAFLDRKRHPFYKHGDAALFLARSPVAGARLLGGSWRAMIRITIAASI